MRMRFNRSLRGLMSLCIVFVLIATSAVVPRVFATESLEDLQHQYEELEDKIKNSADKLGDIKSDMSKQNETINVLNSQIKDVQSQIDLLNKRISMIEREIKALNSKKQEIDDQINLINSQIEQATLEKEQTQQEIDSTISLLLERMRASYLAGSMSELEILFSAGDFSTFFTRSELLKRVSEHDKGLLDDLEKDMKEIEKLAEKLEESRAELDDKKTELDSEKKALVDKQNDAQSSKSKLAQKQSTVESNAQKANSLFLELDRDSKAFRDLLEKYEREQRELDEKIDELIRQGSSTGDESQHEDSGKMIWPMPYPNTYISAGYGYYSPFGVSKFHYAIDICVSGGTTGKNIVAVRSGNVHYSGWHSSYGNYIIIDHGDGIHTLYAHCQSRLVGYGETVSQGQVIAKAGATGNVTGPHLHFEVRINDGGTVKRVNPLNYVSKP